MRKENGICVVAAANAVTAFVVDVVIVRDVYLYQTYGEF
jgi:hypothetical protein